MRPIGIITNAKEKRSQLLRLAQSIGTADAIRTEAAQGCYGFGPKARVMLRTVRFWIGIRLVIILQKKHRFWE